MELRGFVADWNKTHRDKIIFSLQEAPGIQLPVSLEVRYSAVRNKEFLTSENWAKLVSAVELRSHGTMFVTTDDYLFEKGIFEAKIASMNHNFKEHDIIGLLRWIGLEFFPQAQTSKTNS